MLESIGAFIAAVKNAGPPLYAAAFISTVLLLFLPDNIIAQIGLTEFRLTHRSELGATFIGSGSLLAVHGLFAVGRFVGRHWRNWRFERNARKTLTDLTNEEKEFLSSFIIAGKNTNYASIYDGIANGLAAKGVVYRASNLSVPGAPGVLFPYNLQPYARKILNEDRRLLD